MKAPINKGGVWSVRLTDNFAMGITDWIQQVDPDGCIKRTHSAVLHAFLGRMLPQAKPISACTPTLEAEETAAVGQDNVTKKRKISANVTIDPDLHRQARAYAKLVRYTDFSGLVSMLLVAELRRHKEERSGQASSGNSDGQKMIGIDDLIRVLSDLRRNAS